MDHIKQRWAKTEMHLEAWPDPTHERHCRHMQPEAAHAASEVDEDDQPEGDGTSGNNMVRVVILALGLWAALAAVQVWFQ